MGNQPRPHRPTYTTTAHLPRVVLEINARGITYTVQGRVFCERMQADLPTSQTYRVDDGAWRRVFTPSRFRRFLRARRPRALRLPLSALGYDPCDRFIPLSA